MRHLTQNGRAVGVLAPLQSTLFPIPLGVEQAPMGHSQLLRWNWGTPSPVPPLGWGAKMPAYGLEGGGSVVVKCPAVMVGTG